MLECFSSPFNQKLANCIIQLLNSGLKKCQNNYENPVFLEQADVSNKFAKFQCFDKKNDQQGVFHFTRLKLNMSEMRKK